MGQISGAKCESDRFQGRRFERDVAWPKDHGTRQIEGAKQVQMKVMR